MIHPIKHRGAFLSHHAQQSVSSYTAAPFLCPIMHSGTLPVPSCTAACAIIHRGALSVSHHAQRSVPLYTAVLFLCPVMHSGLSHDTPRSFSCVPLCTAAPFLSHHAQRPIPSYTAVPSQCPVMHSGLPHHSPHFVVSSSFNLLMNICSYLLSLQQC